MSYRDMDAEGLLQTLALGISGEAGADRHAELQDAAKRLVPAAESLLRELADTVHRRTVGLVVLASSSNLALRGGASRRIKQAELDGYLRDYHPELLDLPLTYVTKALVTESADIGAKSKGTE
ncbi:hypothetical protein [Leifsonia sp. NPDC080035]|uniref:Uncharacterized protein n=1 Tax=Leifsonia sp. NPDC080035 TaxID=3143936 RepID=A0AAU7GF48_9MICO